MGAALLNLQPVLQAYAGPNNTPPPQPVATPQQSPDNGSLLHTHVAQLLSKNPSFTPDQVATTLGNGVTPTLAAKVMSDVRGIKTQPPANPLTTAFQPVSAQVPPNAESLMNPALPQPVGTPAVSPNRLGATPSAGLAARNANLQQTIDEGGPPNPNGMMMQRPAVAQTVAPTPPVLSAGTISPYTGQGMDAGKAVTSPSAPPANFEANVGTISPYTGQGMEDGQAVTGAPAVAPGAVPKGHGQPGWLEGIERFLPSLAVAIATRDNPRLGASILTGYQQGQAQRRAQNQQEALLEQQKAQQEFANQRALTAEQQKADELKETHTYHEGELKNAADKTASAEQIAADKLKSGTAIAKAIGNAPDGESARRVVLGMDPTDSQGFAAALSNPDGTAKAANPWYGQAEKVRHDQATETTAQQRADDNSRLVTANIGRINAAANLDGTREAYIKATQAQRVKIYQETARLLGLKADDQHDLDKARIAYERALGAAASTNAAANTTRAQAAQSNAETNANKSNGKSGPTAAVLNQVYKNYMSPRSGPFGTKTPAPVKTDPDGNLIPNPAFFTDPKTGSIDKAAQAEAEDQLNEAVGQLGGRYYGAKATPVSQTAGKPTLRSVSRSTFGGSSPVTVKAGRDLATRFGFTDVGGRASSGHMNDSDHYTGNALDFMIHGDTNKGQELANYAKANAKALGVKYIIWQQHIWSPQRDSEGWRMMPDRGSPTENHMDHVHISFSGGNAAPARAASSNGQRTTTFNGTKVAYTVH